MFRRGAETHTRRRMCSLRLCDEFLFDQSMQAATVAGGALSAVASRLAAALREGWLAKADDSASRNQRARLQIFVRE
jgi:hypothetical protein